MNINNHSYNVIRQKKNRFKCGHRQNTNIIQNMSISFRTKKRAPFYYLLEEEREIEIMGIMHKLVYGSKKKSIHFYSAPT